jgi:SET domain-containing protein
MLHGLERRASPRHGDGVFTTVPIRAHALVVEYTGELISPAEAARRYPARDRHDAPEHTFVLQLDATRVIDANVGGNLARYINHSCAPNLEPIAIGDAMWLVALRPIEVGEELGYDYAIELDGRHTPAEKRRFPCRCGAGTCRGTLLRPKRAPAGALARAARHAIARQLRALEASAAAEADLPAARGAGPTTAGGTASSAS